MTDNQKYKLMYEYEILNKDCMMAFRTSEKLKNDFVKAAGSSRNCATLIRQFMINYIIETTKSSENTNNNFENSKE